ncbi:MAG TPA: phospholipid carrier-dependent glycosyltransferase [Opitutaceae bacterium]
MDSQSPPTSATAAAKWRRIALCLTALAVAAYVALLATHIGAYAGGSDSSGYLNNARLLRECKARIPQRSLPGLPPERLEPFAYVPLGFRPVEGHDMAPTYPTGLPLLLAAASVIAGWDAGPHWTIGIQALLGALLVFGLGRQCGLSPGFAGLGALIVALSPLYLFVSFQALSDMPALVWTTGAVMLAWQSRTRPGIFLPLAAGATFAMAVLVRPTNFMAIAPIAIALGLDWRRCVLFGIGGLPGAVFLALFNHAAFGSAFEQGYVGIPGLLSGGYVAMTIAHYARWLPVVLTPVAVLVLGLPWLARAAPRRTLLLTVWIACFAGFYAFYHFTHEVWWSLRFVLPAFPPLAVAAVLVLQRLATRITRPATRWIAGAVLAITVVAWSLPWAKHLHAISIGRGESVYRDSAEWAGENLPSDAVVLAMQTSGALFFYTDFTILRWDRLTPANAAAVDAALTGSQRPLHAVLHPFEVPEVTGKLFPGEWTQVGAVRHVTIWRRESAEVASEH